jgi:hypothetical protein
MPKDFKDQKQVSDVYKAECREKKFCRLPHYLKSEKQSKESKA